MLAVRVEITRLVDASLPGWVECWFEDAHGIRHFFFEKTPVVTSANLGASSSYPTDGVIGCELLEHSVDPEIGIMKVSTRRPWGIESKEGLFLFDVRPEQLVEL